MPGVILRSAFCGEGSQLRMTSSSIFMMVLGALSRHKVAFENWLILAGTKLKVFRLELFR
jgi:hypothetical protein